MADDAPLEPRYVVWRCDHCRNGIEFDVVQLAARAECRVPCPHCGKETSLREPPPPPPLLPDADLLLPISQVIVPEPPAHSPKAVSPPALMPSPIMVSLPPEPLPPTHTRSKADVKWLTDLGVVYFRQHQFHEAFLCFSRAAAQGFATAQFCLAVCYFNGHGVNRDESAALPWLIQAAAQGDVNAEFTLGLAFSLGRGVTADPLSAAQWLNQAAAHGHAEAASRFREVTAKLSPAQLAAAGLEKISLTAPAFVETPSVQPPKETLQKRRHELQRLVLSLFRRK
jgi:hypothetical protein